MSQALDSSDTNSNIVLGTSSSIDSSAPTNTSIFTKLVNKVQYVTSKSLDDPKADEFARQKAIQDSQDKAVADRRAKADAEADKKAKADAEANKKAKDLESRRHFSISRATGNAASGILGIFGFFLLTAVMLYSGHLVANRDIGYNAPFRLLSFLYGTLFFIYYIPMGLYDIYVNKKRLIYYTFLPLSTYEPTGDLEKFFLKPFCYTENQDSQAAKMAVEALYSKAFQKSQIKTS
jgi:hypothetical protein